MADDPDPPNQVSASPYSTGGGGVRLEHRLGAVYLARLLTDSAVAQLGDRPPTRVSFQQSPRTSVDDLVLDSADPSGGPSHQLQIAVRRTPNFVKSDGTTQKLVRALVEADLAAERRTDPLVEVRLAVAVSGHQTHTKELAGLAVVAGNQPGAAEFFKLINEPGKFAAKRRLGHLRDMVAVALGEIDDPEAGAAEHRTWTLLRRTSFLELDLEPGHDDAWSSLADTLKPVVADQSTDGAIGLRDRLEQLAGEFAQTAESSTHPCFAVGFTVSSIQGDWCARQGGHGSSNLTEKRGQWCRGAWSGLARSRNSACPVRTRETVCARRSMRRETYL